MKAVIQRVNYATVKVDDKIVCLLYTSDAADEL